MWICNRCQTKNREGETRCIQCSAPRSARRFGAGTVVETPSVTGAPVKQEIRSPQVHAAPMPDNGKSRPAAAQRATAPQVDESPMSRPHTKRPRNAAARWLVIAGLILAILLPALLIYLAAAHYPWIAPQLNLLLFSAPAQPMTALGAQVPPSALSIGVYVLATALAALVCMMPGLMAMGLGRLLIHLTPRQSRR